VGLRRPDCGGFLNAADRICSATSRQHVSNVRGSGSPYPGSELIHGNANPGLRSALGCHRTSHRDSRDSVFVAQPTAGMRALDGWHRPVWMAGTDRLANRTPGVGLRGAFSMPTTVEHASLRRVGELERGQCPWLLFTTAGTYQRSAVQQGCPLHGTLCRWPASTSRGDRRDFSGLNAPRRHGHSLFLSRLT